MSSGVGRRISPMQFLQGREIQPGSTGLMYTSSPFLAARAHEWLALKLEQQQGVIWTGSHSFALQNPYPWEPLMELLSHRDWWSTSASQALHLTLEGAAPPKAPGFWNGFKLLVEAVEKSGSLLTLSLITPSLPPAAGLEAWSKRLDQAQNCQNWWALALPEPQNSQGWSFWMQLLKSLLGVEEPSHPPLGSVELEALYWAWKLKLPWPSGQDSDLAPKGEVTFESIEGWLRAAERGAVRTLIQKSLQLCSQEGWNFSLWATRVASRLARLRLPPIQVERILSHLLEAEKRIKGQQQPLSALEQLHLVLQVGLEMMGRAGLPSPSGYLRLPKS